MSQHESMPDMSQDGGIVIGSDGDVLPSYSGINEPTFTVDTSARSTAVEDQMAEDSYDGYIPPAEDVYIPPDDEFSRNPFVDADDRGVAPDSGTDEPEEIVEVQNPPTGRFWTPREDRWGESASDDNRALRHIPDSIIESRRSRSGQDNQRI